MKELVRFIQYCLNQELSAGTVTKKVKHLKRAFQLAEDRGQLDRHPLRKLRPPKVAKRKVRVFTDDECDRLHAAVRSNGSFSFACAWAQACSVGN